MSVGFEPRGLWLHGTFGFGARWLLSICGCWRWELILTSSASCNLFDRVDTLHWLSILGGKKRCFVIKFAQQKYKIIVKKHFADFSQMISVSSQRRERISVGPKDGQFKSFPLLCAATLSLEDSQECSLHVSLIWPRTQMRHTCLNLFFTLCFPKPC